MNGSYKYFAIKLHLCIHFTEQLIMQNEASHVIMAQFTAINGLCPEINSSIY